MLTFDGLLQNVELKTNTTNTKELLINDAKYPKVVLLQTIVIRRHG